MRGCVITLASLRAVRGCFITLASLRTVRGGFVGILACFAKSGVIVFGVLRCPGGAGFGTEQPFSSFSSGYNWTDHQPVK